MRRRYVLALALATALIFGLVGTAAGYAMWHSGTGEATPIVTNRTADQLGGNFDFCLNYRLVGDNQTKCWRNIGQPPDCWANAKIGDPLPEICR